MPFISLWSYVIISFTVQAPASQSIDWIFAARKPLFLVAFLYCSSVSDWREAELRYAYEASRSPLISAPQRASTRLATASRSASGVAAPDFPSPIGDTAQDAKVKTATQTAANRPVCRQTATRKA